MILTTPASPITAEVTPFPPVEIDFNNDSVPDVLIPGRISQVNLRPQGTNRILSIFELGAYLAEALSDGSFIGASPDALLHWREEDPVMSACFTGGGLVCFGNFLGGFDYPGVEFDISGATHYGWIEFESSPFVPKAIIYRWAYESVPGASLLAGQIPEPSSAALLLAVLPIFLRRNR